MSGADSASTAWRKGSRSGGGGFGGGDCVEIAALPDHIDVRDSKNSGGPKLRFTCSEWEAFARGIKAGNHDP